MTPRLRRQPEHSRELVKECSIGGRWIEALTETAEQDLVATLGGVLEYQVWRLAAVRTANMPDSEPVNMRQPIFPLELRRS